MLEKIISKGILELAIEDVQSLSKDDYALVRKDYFGASDSSILCGVNLYKNMNDLLKEKNAKYITKEEREVGEKAIVKKGYDLEPIILQKAEEELGQPVLKPKDMFRFKAHTILSVNFDGVLEQDTNLYPVEAKLVSKWGEKYYNKTITKEDALAVDMKLEGTDLATHIKKKALKFGIPAYYYTQVQQQLAGLNSNHGFLAAMFDDTWTFKLFLVKRDEYVINKLYEIAELNKDKIKIGDN